MIQAELRGELYSGDLPKGEGKELPSNIYDAWDVVEADIGLVGEDGYDYFTFYVCTIKKLKTILEDQSFRFGRHIIFVQYFDWSIVRQAISQVVSSAQGDTWDEVAMKIARYGQYEFEDYQE